MKRRMDITLRLSFVKRVIEEIMEELAQFKGRSSKQRILRNEKIGLSEHRKDKLIYKISIFGVNDGK